MKRLIVFLLFLIPSIAFSQSVCGKYFKMINGNQYGVASETIFFTDGTYSTIQSNFQTGDITPYSGSYKQEGNTLIYNIGDDIYKIQLVWINSTKYMLKTNGYVFIFQQYAMPITTPGNTYNNYPSNQNQPPQQCLNCIGTGVCKLCNGSGYASYTIGNTYPKCSTCGGTGRCKYCSGTGIFHP